jgi:N-acetylglucosamine kinase-like BadF-type ATPase
MKELIGNNEIKVIINSDPETCLSSGTLGKLEGIIMIAGTGSIVVGMFFYKKGVDQKNNKRFRAGFEKLTIRGMVSFNIIIRGPLLGDKGNGWCIGHDILVAITSSIDGTVIKLITLREKRHFYWRN